MARWSMVLILVAGCARTTQKEPEEPAPEVRIRADVLTGAERVVGDFVQIDLLIENRTPQAILVGGIGVRHDLSAPLLRLAHSVYGEVGHDSVTGIFTYRSLVQKATQEMFEEGLLLPGQSLTWSQRVRILGPTEEVRVDFRVIPDEDLRRGIYLPIGPTGPNRQYGRADDGGLERFEAHRRRKARRGTGPGPAAVLVSGAIRDIEPEQRTLQIELNPRPASFRRSEAAARTAGRILTYCRKFQGWIAETDDGHLLVSATRVVELPPAPVGLYRDLDLKDGLELRIEPDNALGLKTKAGDGMYRRGHYARIPAFRALAVLEKIRELKRSVRKRIYYLDSYYYELK